MARKLAPGKPKCSYRQNLLATLQQIVSLHDLTAGPHRQPERPQCGARAAAGPASLHAPHRPISRPGLPRPLPCRHRAASTLEAPFCFTNETRGTYDTLCLLVRNCSVCQLQSGASAVLAPALKYLTDALALSWRRRITSSANRRYLSGSTFYVTSQLAGLQVRTPESLPRCSWGHRVQGWCRVGCGSTICRSEQCQQHAESCSVSVHEPSSGACAGRSDACVQRHIIFGRMWTSGSPGMWSAWQGMLPTWCPAS